MTAEAHLAVAALKEWGAVAHALLDGRQTLLLRKGGIHERSFEVFADDGEWLVVFPTVAHSHAERTRSEHRDLLAAGAADATEEAVTVRCAVRILAAVAVARPERLPELADMHVWTDASVVEDRLNFRPKHPLQALVVEAAPLAEPVTLPREERFGGCRSWLELPLHEVATGPSVHGPERLAADAERVRATVG